MSEKLDSLISWAKSNGAHIDSRISFVYSKEKGVHAIINKDIEQNDGLDKEELIKVPKKILVTLSLAQSVLGQNIKCKKNINGVTQLFLSQLKFDQNKSDEVLVIYENLKPYIDYLPIEKVIPYYWNAKEKKLVQQTEVGRLAKIKFEEILEEWYELVKQLPSTPSSEINLKFYKDYKSGIIDDDKLYDILNNKEITSWTSFPAYLWSSSIFYGRAFPHILIDSKSKDLNEAFLLPIVDLLNHENGHPVKWDYDSGDEMVTFKSMTEGVLPKDSELFNNYGDKTNCELLLGYGFVLDNNIFDSVGLTIRVPNADTILAKASKIGNYNLPTFNEDLQAVSFTLLRKSTELPEELIVFFSLLYQLSSERNQYTLRMKLEGLQSLRELLNQQLQVLKTSTSTQESTSGLRDFVLQQIKKYKRNQATIYQNSIDQISRLEKSLVKTYKPLTLKTILKKNNTNNTKEDTEFVNSIYETFGIQSYEEIVKRDLQNSILILWIIRAHTKYNSKSSSSSSNTTMYPDFVYHTYEDVKKSISITKEDVLEYQPMYSSLFPNLSKKYPEIYAGNDSVWNLRAFVIASTVIDRIVFVRKVNDDVYILDKHLMNK